MSNSASGSNRKINGCVRAGRTVCPFRQQIRERKQPMLSLSYLATSAGTDASVDGGQSPFIKIVDKGGLAMLFCTQRGYDRKFTYECYAICVEMVDKYEFAR